MRRTLHSLVATLAATLAAALSTALSTAGAQTATTPRRAEQAHSWLQLFQEHRLDARWSLLGELQLRRADIPGAAPQQLLARGALQRVLTTGASVAAGYGYAATAVYGEAPAAAPFGEHRLWQQLQLSQRTGPVAWAHRFRTEQRWLEQPSTETWRFRQRVRAFTRATVDAPSLGVAAPRLYLTPWAELFVGVGGATGGQVFDQSRVALQAGYRVTPRLRVEAGYMQQYVQRAAGRETENNHTLLVSLFATSGWSGS